MRRWVIPLVVALLLTVGFYASDSDAVLTGPTPSTTIVLVTELPGQNSGRGNSDASGGGGPSDPCAMRWVRVTTSVGGPLGEFPSTIVRDGVVHDLYVRQWPCGGLEGTAETSYFRRIAVADLVPELRRRVEAAIPEPVTTFAPWDAKRRWTFVNVPVDFRVVAAAVSPVSLSNSLSNGLTSVSATLTATPMLVTFSPGEPKGVDVSCSTADALAPYVIKMPGACSYQYRNSSAVSANGRTFPVTITVTWALYLESSEGARDLEPFERTWTSDIGVAEVQALVTCTGPLPEQGGC